MVKFTMDDSSCQKSLFKEFFGHEYSMKINSRGTQILYLLVKRATADQPVMETVTSVVLSAKGAQRLHIA